MKANYIKPKTNYAQAVDANKQYRRMITRRLMMAVALTLNDICGFGTVRIVRVLKGLAEIITGYAVFSAEMTKDMAAELRDRGIELPAELLGEDKEARSENRLHT
jgi:hypothetical protein